MKQTYILLFVSFLLSLSGCESGKQDSIALAEEKNDQTFDTKAEEKEADFIAEIIQRSYAEIKLAELASTKSSNKQIHDLAQQLVSDYSKTLAEFQNFAERKGIAVPVDEGENSKEKINKLSSEKDPDFDKKWCEELQIENKKTIRKLELTLKKSKDEELKEIIDVALVHLRSHTSKLASLPNTSLK